PLTADVEAGTHRATFVLTGHNDQFAAFEVVAKESPERPIKATLQKIPPGSILVESEVKGVEVFLDGKAAGRTPAALRGVEGGKHEIRVLGIERLLGVEPGAEK